MKIKKLEPTERLIWAFCNRKGETAKKFFFELIVILDIFQPKNHIWHININFIFLAVFPLSIAKGPYSSEVR